MARDDWGVERLSKQHDRADFDSGRPALDDWLKQQSGQFDRRDLAWTYVATRRGERRVLGYYALANHRVSYSELPGAEAKGLPPIDVPVVLLGKLAVDLLAQGQGLGAHLLIDALRRCQMIAEQTGVRAVEVHAIDDAARRFYLKFGFVELLDDPQHLFLSTQVIRRLNLLP